MAKKWDIDYFEIFRFVLDGFKSEQKKVESNKDSEDLTFKLVDVEDEFLKVVYEKFGLKAKLDDDVRRKVYNFIKREIHIMKENGDVFGVSRGKYSFSKKYEFKLDVSGEKGKEYAKGFIPVQRTLLVDAWYSNHFYKNDFFFVFGDEEKVVSDEVAKIISDKLKKEKKIISNFSSEDIELARKEYESVYKDLSKKEFEEKIKAKAVAKEIIYVLDHKEIYDKKGPTVSGLVKYFVKKHNVGFEDLKSEFIFNLKSFETSVALHNFLDKKINGDLSE